MLLFEPDKTKAIAGPKNKRFWLTHDENKKEELDEAASFSDICLDVMVATDLIYVRSTWVWWLENTLNGDIITSEDSRRLHDRLHEHEK